MSDELVVDDGDRDRVRTAIAHIRREDCDFLTAESVAMYAQVDERVAREVMHEEGL
jgi:hypothetical protein